MPTWTFPDDAAARFCANMLLSDRLPLNMKRGHLLQYLEKEGITQDSTGEEIRYALRKLILGVCTKRERAIVAQVVTDVYEHPFIQ